ncbi:haloacid dehalogenase-like hydrolase family protein [Tanacetum coccineum]
MGFMMNYKLYTHKSYGSVERNREVVRLPTGNALQDADRVLPDFFDFTDVIHGGYCRIAASKCSDGNKDTDFKTRDPAVDDVGQYESVELSIHLCNDEFIRKLNKDWRNEDHVTDVLSMSHRVPELKLLMIRNPSSDAAVTGSMGNIIPESARSTLNTSGAQTPANPLMLCSGINSRIKRERIGQEYGNVGDCCWLGRISPLNTSQPQNLTDSYVAIVAPVTSTESGPSVARM